MTLPRLFVSAARSKYTSLVLGLVSLQCANEVSAPEPETNLGSSRSELQLAYGSAVHLVTGNFLAAPAARTVAAIRNTNVNGGPHASCGATFVSKHYAVTAAHCVPNITIRTGTVTVEETVLEQLDLPQLNAYATVSGTWPNWQPGATLTTGYGILPTTCTVTRRCSSAFGTRQGCPIPEDADIALLRCPDRVASNRARTTASLASAGLPSNFDDLFDFVITVWWFHEVYNLPIENDGTERWTHYGQKTTVLSDNWHYTRKHQLLPLLSLQFPNGTRYRTTQMNHATLNGVDAPACHGTSGSGVFAGDTNVLLGPVIAPGAASQIQGRLCERFDVAQPGAENTRYIRGAITAAFVAGAGEIASDS
jgi:hypothetical protein